MTVGERVEIACLRGVEGVFGCGVVRREASEFDL